MYEDEIEWMVQAKRTYELVSLELVKESYAICYSKYNKKLNMMTVTL